MTVQEALAHIAKLCEQKRRVFVSSSRTDSYEDGYGDGARKVASEILEAIKEVGEVPLSAMMPKVEATITGKRNISIRTLTQDADQWVRLNAPNFGEMMYAASHQELSYVLLVNPGQDLIRVCNYIKTMGAQT